MPEQMVQMECPKCGGRAFDISKIPKEQIVVGLKCPRCQNVVTVTCTFASERKKTKRVK